MLYRQNEILTPVWEGEISYQESVLPIQEHTGEVAPISLLYPIKRIRKVQNAALTKTYVEGVDYTLEEGKLVILDGEIFTLPYPQFYPMTGEIASTDGGAICFSEGSWFHSRQIVVTYEHAEGYNGYIPQRKGDLLPHIHAKLAEKKAINLLAFGDSITVGANSSGFKDINVSPFMPIYPQLFAEGLQMQYGVVGTQLINPSVGGKNTAWGAQEINGVLNDCEELDLAIIAFGMNDPNLSPDSYVSYIEYIISQIKAKSERTDILVVAPMLANPKAVGFYGTQSSFHHSLIEIEREGVAVVNMTRMHEDMLCRKAYADMTGNNVNHPNDYLARVYAQALLETLKMPNPAQEEHNVTKGCNATFGSTLAFSVAGAAFIGKKKDEE